jgi:hypothetical protein
VVPLLSSKLRVFVFIYLTYVYAVASRAAALEQDHAMTLEASKEVGRVA